MASPMAHRRSYSSSVVQVDRAIRQKEKERSRPTSALTSTSRSASSVGTRPPSAPMVPPRPPEQPRPASATSVQARHMSLRRKSSIAMDKAIMGMALGLTQSGQDEEDDVFELFTGGKSAAYDAKDASPPQGATQRRSASAVSRSHTGGEFSTAKSMAFDTDLFAPPSQGFTRPSTVEPKNWCLVRAPSGRLLRRIPFVEWKTLSVLFSKNAADYFGQPEEPESPASARRARRSPIPESEQQYHPLARETLKAVVEAGYPLSPVPKSGCFTPTGGFYVDHEVRYAIEDSVTLRDFRGIRESVNPLFDVSPNKIQAAATRDLAIKKMQAHLRKAATLDASLKHPCNSLQVEVTGSGFDGEDSDSERPKDDPDDGGASDNVEAFFAKLQQAAEADIRRKQEMDCEIELWIHLGSLGISTKDMAGDSGSVQAWVKLCQTHDLPPDTQLTVKMKRLVVDQRVVDISLCFRYISASRAVKRSMLGMIQQASVGESSAGRRKNWLVIEASAALQHYLYGYCLGQLAIRPPTEAANASFFLSATRKEGGLLPSANSLLVAASPTSAANDVALKSLPPPRKRKISPLHQAEHRDPPIQPMFAGSPTCPLRPEEARANHNKCYNSLSLAAQRSVATAILHRQRCRRLVQEGKPPFFFHSIQREEKRGDDRRRKQKRLLRRQQMEEGFVDSDDSSECDFEGINADLTTFNPPPGPRQWRVFELV